MAEQILIVGAGYVGLVTAACLADAQKNVVAIERNEHKRTLLQQGKSPFYEPDLDPLISQGIARGNLTFVGSMSDGLATNPDFIMICVGTPSLPNGDVDESFVVTV